MSVPLIQEITATEAIFTDGQRLPLPEGTRVSFLDVPPDRNAPPGRYYRLVRIDGMVEAEDEGGFKSLVPHRSGVMISPIHNLVNVKSSFAYLEKRRADFQASNEYIPIPDHIL